MDVQILDFFTLNFLSYSQVCENVSDIASFSSSPP